jgi:magnesium-transporting ATPase (P-type)
VQVCKFSVIGRIPFDSDRKRETVVTAHSDPVLEAATKVLERLERKHTGGKPRASGSTLDLLETDRMQQDLLRMPDYEKATTLHAQAMVDHPPESRVWVKGADTPMQPLIDKALGPDAAWSTVETSMTSFANVGLRCLILASKVPCRIWHNNAILDRFFNSHYAHQIGFLECLSGGWGCKVDPELRPAPGDQRGVPRAVEQRAQDHLGAARRQGQDCQDGRDQRQD